MYLNYLVPKEESRPCQPSPCGSNTICEEHNNAAACKCIENYFGDPYIECRPECVINSDCPKFSACINNKCINPCLNMCGQNAECNVINHNPNCECSLGYTGNPILGCHLIKEPPKCKTIVASEITEVVDIFYSIS